MKIYLNDELVEVNELRMYSEDTIVIPPEQPPVVQPPKDDTPPVRPSLPSGAIGPITGTKAGLKLTLPRDGEKSILFRVPEEVVAPIVSFSFAPQNTVACTWRLWVSETPYGPAIDSFRGDLEHYGRRGSQFSLWVAPIGNGYENRGAAITKGKNYYLNVKVEGNSAPADASWKIGGNFEWDR
jgi:hypothetical protein